MTDPVQGVLGLLRKYGQVEGSHHKAWVIDQVVQTLLNDLKQYEKFVSDYEGDPDDEDTYCEWDKGIPP